MTTDVAEDTELDEAQSYDDLGLDVLSESPDSSNAIIQDLREHQPDSITPDGTVVQRDQSAIRQATDGAKMTADFVIVTRTADVNRQGNMVQIMPSNLGKGLRTEEYEKNPIVLFEHGFGGVALPIGRSADDNGNLTIKKAARKATATVFFSQSLAIANDIFRLVDENIMRMASVAYWPQLGIRVKQKKPTPLPQGVEEMQFRFRGWDIVESIMYEWSITPIGADSGSLKQCLSRGTIAGEKFTPTLKPILQRFAGPEQVWSPGMDFPTKPQEPNSVMIQGRAEDVDRITQQLGGGAFVTYESDDGRKHVDAVLNRPIGTTTPERSESPEDETRVDGNSQSATNPVDEEQQAQRREQQETPTPQPTITGEQLAQAFQQRQEPQVDMNAFAQKLTQTVEQTIENKLSPLVDEQNALNAELERRTGKLPD